MAFGKPQKSDSSKQAEGTNNLPKAADATERGGPSQRLQKIRAAVTAELEDAKNLDSAGVPTLAALEARAGVGRVTAAEALAAYDAVKADLAAGQAPDSSAVRPARASRVPKYPARKHTEWREERTKGGDGQLQVHMVRRDRQRLQFPVALYSLTAKPVTVKNALEYEAALDRAFKGWDAFTPDEQAVLYARETGAA